MLSLTSIGLGEKINNNRKIERKEAIRVMMKRNFKKSRKKIRAK